MPTTVKLKMTGVEDILKNHNLEPGGAAQKFVTSECSKHLEPYMPFLTHTLIASKTIGEGNESSLIIVNSPQARYLYYGKVMIGRAPKKAIDKDLVYTTAHNAKAGPFWDKRMWEEKGKEILGGLASLLGGKAK